MSETVGARLVQAIAAQDEAAIAECFCHDFRALTPSGLKERAGRMKRPLIAAWFGDSTVIDLVDARTDEVGGRLLLTYRFEGVEEGQPYVVQQELFCTLDHGKIAAADLLCSGFLPRRRPSRTKDSAADRDDLGAPLTLWRRHDHLVADLRAEQRLAERRVGETRPRSRSRRPSPRRRRARSTRVSRRRRRCSLRPPLRRR